jgi:(heptosyl)LPS beta-1,4-glucosyltransferase
MEAIMNQSPISVVIHTKNAAKTINQTLKSVSWAAEIIVLDMHSTDRTIEIAQKHTRKIHTVKDYGFADPARNQGAKFASHDWIFSVDADEEVPSTLADKLVQLTQDNIDVWQIPRKNIIFSRWVKHSGWWPDYQTRFYRKGKIKWVGKMHEDPQIIGKSAQLPDSVKYALVHHNYQSITQYIDRLNRYTTIKANESSENIDNFPQASMQAFTQEFNRKYFLLEGHKDGDVGLYLAMLQSLYQMVVILKQWENQGFTKHPVHFDQIHRDLVNDLAYWQADKKISQSNSLLPRWYWKLRRKLRA